MANINSSTIIDEFHEAHRNWWYDKEKKAENQQQSSQLNPFEKESMIARTPISQAQENSPSIGIVEKAHQKPSGRRDSDIDRLYRLSNLMHACAGRDD